jgi:hypothetical protein
LSDRDSKEVRNEMDHLPVYKVLHPDEEIWACLRLWRVATALRSWRSAVWPS